MSLDNRQILELARQGLSAQEIADALGYDVEAVSFVLVNDREVASKIERADTNKLEAEFQSLEDLAIGAIREVLTDSDVKASTKMNAAAYVLDQRLGLKAPKTLNMTFNIVEFNDRLREVKRRKAELEAVTVESTSKLIAA